jgi:3-methyladenine DNA glycosylase/8-oxoguanine DNA glycosylase
MTAQAPARLHFTGNDEADALLAEEPLALLIGFVLDQQVPVQKAFSGPLELKRRIGVLDASAIAGMDPGELDSAFRERPALPSPRTTTGTPLASGPRRATARTSSSAFSTCRESAR